MLEDIMPCDSGCGINADPEDGFGYCTCGEEIKRHEVKQLFIKLLDEQRDNINSTTDAIEPIIQLYEEVRRL